MDMTGSRRIEAPRTRVWDALNDPEVLKASIPGCESVDRTGPDSFQAKVAIRIGPMAAKFGGKVTLTNIRAPEGYTITGEGQGGAMGFARGGADVALAEEGPNVTLLTYDVKAQVGGKMAQLGARLVDSTARSMADQFFDRFAANVAAPQPAAAQPGALSPVPDPVPAALGASMAAPQTIAPTSITVGRAAGTTGAPAPKPTPGTMRVGTPPSGGLATLLSRIPRQPYGLPINFWIGSALFAVILALLFVIG